MIALNASNPYVAVAALAICFGAVELTEGAFWGGAMTVGQGDTMAVCGFMNTGGNLGGIIGIPIVAYFSGQHAWHTAFFIGVGFAHRQCGGVARHPDRTAARGDPGAVGALAGVKSEAMTGRWQFWIDRGGTFTDIVARAPDGALAHVEIAVGEPRAISGRGAGGNPAPA